MSKCEYAMSSEVENMCVVAKGCDHGPAPLPEEGKWVQAKQIGDISGYTHGIGWCAPQQGACKLSLNVKNGVIEEALVLHSAGENDHIQLGQVHLAKFHIGGHGDAVASDDDLSANAHGGDGHARAAQQINRGDGFRFLEAGSKQHVNHIQSSRHAATWR